MKKRRSLWPLVGIAVIFLIAVWYHVSGIMSNYIPSQEQRVVTRVIDGDTIVVEGGDRVRLLDIDTPERGESCSSEATTRLTELIDGQSVVMERRGEDKDVYGRLLRYVFLNGTMINAAMVREGWANLYVVEKGPYYSLLVEVEQLAKQEGLCVWK